MPTDQSSSFESSNHTAPPVTEGGTEGPLPLPDESPFLSDHGIGAPAPPPGPRTPAAPPSGLSQFPPPSGGAAMASARETQMIARTTASQMVPRAVVAPNSPAPIPGYGGGVAQDSVSSFPMYMAGGAATDNFAPGGRGSGAIPMVAAGGDTELVERLRSILLTTTDSLQGRLVELYLGLVTAEALVPTDTLLEGAERTGRFSRYKTSQQKMKSLQQLVIAELKLEADKVGGNAVVGTKVTTTMDHGVVLIVATGTAVRVV